MKYLCGTTSFLFLALAALASEIPNTPAAAAPLSSSVTLHSITLPHFEPDLPVAAGREEFLAVCVSCHSPRYVTMQPPFSQVQWEQTVDKMTNVYGAQVAPEQRSSIVSYLTVVHGPNTGPAPSAASDDDFSTSAAPVRLRSGTAPSLQVAAEPTRHAAQVSRGAELFQQSCAGCHGVGGKGDGPVANVLLRKPKNLTGTRFSVELISQVLWDGKPGTAMPAWRCVPETDRAALAAFVLTLHAPAKPEPVPAETVRRGSTVFEQNCAPCHGVSGDGKGTAAVSLLPQPANFKLKQPDSDYLIQVLSEGIPGTGMPSWKAQIPESDRRALTAFVRSLFAPADIGGN